MRSKDSRVYIIRTEADLNRLYDDIETELNHGVLLARFEPYDPKRSTLQNALWWAYMTDWGNQKGYTKDQMAGVVKIGVGHSDEVEINKCYYPLPRATHDLGVRAMQELIKQAEIWASENEVIIHAPNYRNEAME